MSRNNPEKMPKIPEAFQLGEFSFSIKPKELSDTAGNLVHLRSQTAEVLAYLLHNQGKVVSKAAFFENV